ncbi:LuxR C-terminal-related transcriptional regulator [Mycolicibacterium sp. XJ870]
MIRRWPLVGRSEELAVIADATRVTTERARGIVLSGSAGVGKTRLAREAVAGCGPRNARRHWIVGTASARSVPLGAFADIASDFGPDPLRRVREVIDGLVGDRHNGEVVIGVDDAHLLDDLSAFTVHQLVIRRLATVIMTIRSGESPPDTITGVWKDQHLERLELQPLSLVETTILIEKVLDGPVQSLCARQLWQYTQGNALYLRHLLENEVHAGRMARHSGMWLWDGHPALSPTLTEILEARIAQIPTAIRGVLDALAVTEPLDTDVLAAITDPDALPEAEALGLVNVDSRVRPPMVRLAHPMLGEIRRTDSFRLRRLRGQIAAELARKGDTDPRDLVRRAVLAMESDLAPDPELLLAAASAAMQLLDQRLAATLAERAVAAGGGYEARMAQAMANFWLERPTEVESILGELAGQTTGPARTQVAIMRATNFAAELGKPASAEQELNNALVADDDVAQPIETALLALIDLVRGHSRAAVEVAVTAHAGSPGSDVAKMLLIWVLVTGYGDLGQIDEIDPAADRGYRLAERSEEVSHARFQVAFLQANAYRRAGAITTSDATIARIRRETLDIPFEGSWHSVLVGMSAMSRGALDDARRSLRESVAYLGTGDSGRMVKSFGRTWLTTVTAMAGRATDARREFDAIEWWAQDSDACIFDPERSIAEAWTCAAEGAVSQAISIVRDAAAKESELGRPAWEVVLLQTATQFGDHTTAARLAELADRVQGPRAPAATAHAAALAAGNGDRLVEASAQYEAFGDRLAAADAAAQAVIAYANAGLRGAALTASAMAQRLATECQGAQTPALRAGTTPQPFTARQHEIISLAAQGLSNKNIAERLTMSIRSVEGHLFRASQRVAANSREQLISILHGS